MVENAVEGRPDHRRVRLAWRLQKLDSKRDGTRKNLERVSVPRTGSASRRHGEVGKTHPAQLSLQPGVELMARRRLAYLTHCSRECW